MTGAMAGYTTLSVKLSSRSGRYDDVVFFM